MGRFREWVDCFWLEKDKQVWLDEIDFMEPYFRECPHSHEILANMLVRVNNLQANSASAESASVAELFTQMKAVIVGDQEKDATTVLLTEKEAHIHITYVCSNLDTHTHNDTY